MIKQRKLAPRSTNERFWLWQVLAKQLDSPLLSLFELRRVSNDSSKALSRGGFSQASGAGLGRSGGSCLMKPNSGVEVRVVSDRNSLLLQELLDNPLFDGCLIGPLVDSSRRRFV